MENSLSDNDDSSSESDVDLSSDDASDSSSKHQSFSSEQQYSQGDKTTLSVCLDNQSVPMKTTLLDDVDLDAFYLPLDDNFQYEFIKKQSDVLNQATYLDDSYSYSDEYISTSPNSNLFPENTSEVDHISVSESNSLSVVVTNVSGHICEVRNLF